MRALYRLGLKRLNGLYLPAHIICFWLELLEMVLNLVDDCGVFELRAVGCKVDGLGTVTEKLHFAADIVIALFKGCEGRRSLTFEAKRSADFGPIDFQGSTALERIVDKLAGRETQCFVLGWPKR